MTATPTKNDVGASIAAAVVVLAAVQVRDQPRQPDRVDLVDAACARVVAFLGRVAGDREHVVDSLGVGAEQERLEPRDRHVARRQVRNRLDPAGTLDRDRGHDAAHARAGARVVVDIDEVRLARLAQGMARLDERAVVGAERGVELDRDDELLLAEHPGEPGLLRRGLRCVGELALADDERRGRGAILLDRAADRLDLCRRRAAAAADDAGAEPPRLRRELGEVVRGRVREDDPVAGEAREADVRERGEHEPVALHRGERVQGRRRAGAVVRPGRGDIELDEPLRRGLGRDAAERLAVGVEGHQRDDWERRHAAHGLDRGDELVEIEERLEHEQVDAAALEDLRLLAEALALLGGVEPLDVADRADRARDVDVRARHLSGLAREAHRRRVDPLELVLEVVPRQLAPVGAERVRLDQLGAGADEARVQGDDALGRAQVRLLRAAEARDCARDQRAHAAVGHDRRPGAEAVLEAARHRASLEAGRAAKRPLQGSRARGRRFRACPACAG